MLDKAVANSAWNREQWLKEAITAYSNHEAYLREEVQRGLADFEAGRFISDEQMEKEASDLLQTLGNNRHS